ncbi:glutamyl-tRNA synthetase [Lewinella marina]|uniref:Glutamate--tRNA ligase n=1 Tax=Neolewinella marina TaxID=438751 RepID=A0A2G0CBF4_9BACT|nr:glutamate--tRNA ligase [Neolewinella marina]NJB87154.1 glutamyl-tRNA synthetase [Neolewinella marina]PHK97319.1 glutamate--tRNA ligase [Neolewinella marina]
MVDVRVRFAPSPTGALHIGGLRTALYNYLFARKHGGAFILRVEDTDQKRYVPGAEEYIVNSLEWAGIRPDEGPGIGGDYGPYRQSERKAIYAKYTQHLLDSGQAYYAFDTEEELDQRRESEKAAGNHNFRYDAATRGGMRNSLSLGKEQTEALLAADTPYVVRLRVEPGQMVHISDTVRGDVAFQSEEVDDKVLMKADGLPTYHLANVVDDHLMKITHVIRGEEWLPSTALHVLLYRAFGWEKSMPAFAHLPLLLKPNGKGKLSKRDGQQLGFPVFPLDWGSGEEHLSGFRESGFLAPAVVNFLAFLGWNPGTEQEIFSLEALVEAFDLDRINKSGAQYDFEKARWYNQQYLIATPDEQLGPRVEAVFAAHGHPVSEELAITIAGLLKERVHTLEEFYEQGLYFVERVGITDEKTARKKWKPELRPRFEQLRAALGELDTWTALTIKDRTVAFMETNGLGFGQVLPVLRLAVSGSTSGPDAFAILEAVGQEETLARLGEGYNLLDRVKAS